MMGLKNKLTSSLPSVEFVDDSKMCWPWKAPIPQYPEFLTDGSHWPKISIVTPSFNQGQFIEETIRSVLLQGYPNLEYIIIDGGSTDNSVEIIKKYEPWLTYWVSEPDRGQSHAINKGLNRCTGEYFAWINSDDIYKPTTFFSVAKAVRKNPLGIIYYGDCEIVDDEGQFLSLYQGKPFDVRELMLVTKQQHNIAQPSSFFLTSALKQIGGLNENLHMIMDIDTYLRLSSQFGSGNIYYNPEVWSCFRRHSSQKTYNAVPKFQNERLIVLDNIYQQPRNGIFSDPVIRRKAYAWAYLTYSNGLLKEGKRNKCLLYLTKAITSDLSIIFRPKFLKHFKALAKTILNVNEKDL